MQSYTIANRFCRARTVGSDSCTLQGPRRLLLPLYRCDAWSGGRSNFALVGAVSFSARCIYAQRNFFADAITESGLSGIASRHGYRIQHTKLELYNLREDLEETKNVVAEYPDAVNRLVALAETARSDLGDGLTDRAAVNTRPSGFVDRIDIDN